MRNDATNGETALDMIEANANLVVEQLKPIGNVQFGFNAESVKWLEGYIERQRVRPDMTADQVINLVQVLGSYLGHCVITCYGGHWELNQGSWAVVFDQANAVYPFNKVAKQFENGTTDSVFSFFRTIAPVFKRA